jgi:hypothetical protein
MKEALSSSETSVLRGAIRPNIPEDAILNTSIIRLKKYSLSERTQDQVIPSVLYIQLEVTSSEHTEDLQHSTVALARPTNWQMKVRRTNTETVMMGLCLQVGFRPTTYRMTEMRSLRRRAANLKHLPLPPYGNFLRLCGLVVKLPGRRPRGPGFDSRRYQIF